MVFLKKTFALAPENFNFPAEKNIYVLLLSTFLDLSLMLGLELLALKCFYLVPTHIKSLNLNQKQTKYYVVITIWILIITNI